MADSLSLDRANLVSLWVESILYGGFLVLFGASLYILLYRKLHGRVNRTMTVASVLMFCLITSHLVCDLIRAIIAFTTAPRNPKDFYGDISENSEWAKNIIYYLVSVLGDAIVVYRCWIVWNGYLRVMVLPCILLVATTVVGAFSCQALTTIRPGEAIFSNKLAHWALPFFSLTLVTNALCTLLIATRISVMSKKGRDLGKINSKLWRVAIILIESAAIYSFALFAMIGTYVSGSNAQYIVVDALPPLIGIVFESIIARVGLGLSSEEDTDNCDLSLGHEMSNSPGEEQPGSLSAGRQAIHINVRRHSQVDRSEANSTRTNRDVEMFASSGGERTHGGSRTPKSVPF